MKLTLTISLFLILATFAKCQTTIAIKGARVILVNQSVPESPIPNAPNAPTASITDDAEDTYDWTNNPLFPSLSDYEYSINGSPFATVTQKPLLIGNVAIGIGQVLVRVKAIGINPPSATIYNNAPFTVNVPPHNGEIIPYNYAFHLDTSSVTSAGVYASDGTLIRTLWSGQRIGAGTYYGHQDSLNDAGQVYNRTGTVVRVLSSNVQYTWDGAIIGNTSSVHSGASKLRAASQPRGLVVAGDWIYAAGQYNESSSTHYKYPLSNPTTKAYAEGATAQAYPQNVDYISADNNNVYWGGWDAASPGGYLRSFVAVSAINTDYDVAFTNGVAYTMNNGRTYPSTIGFMNDSYGSDDRYRTVPLGMAVQKSGNYLFLSRNNNTLYVIDKRTNHGEVVQTINFTGGCGKLAADDNNHLYVTHVTSGVIEKFTVNSDGTLTTTGFTISGNAPGYITLKPDGTELAVCDYVDQIVKFYSTTTGSQTHTLGTVGGYLTNSDVTDTKFYWKDSRGFYYPHFLYMPDGTYYVGDPENRRIQHFTSTGTYIDQIAYVSHTYYVQALKNAPTRVFAGFLEFEIDYSVPLTATTGWKLKRNWGSGYTTEFNYDEVFGNVAQLSNGRTYAVARGYVGGSNQNNLHIVELVNGGIARNTGIVVPGRTSIEEEDGSLTVNYGNAVGAYTPVFKRTLTGFDGSNNPIWGSDVEIARTPIATIYDPVSDRVIKDSTGVIFFNIAAQNVFDSKDFHLGKVKFGGSTYQWETARGTSRSYDGQFPADGAFDNGNTVNLGGNGAGGKAVILGSNIIWNYHGEFWKQAQANKFNHFDSRTGLFVGQFGSVTLDTWGEEAPDNGGDGNCLNHSLVQGTDGKYYFYNNGESSGLHRWSITGMNTIKIQTATSTSGAVVPDGIDLLSGLNWDSDPWNVRTLTDNFNGWSVTPSQYGGWGSDHVKYIVGMKSYDITKHPDLSLSVQFSAPHEADFTRTLGTNTNLSSWKLKGVLNFDRHNFGDDNKHDGAWLEVQDNLGRPIARFNPIRGTSSSYIEANMQRMYTIPNDNRTQYRLFNYNQPFEIGYNGGSLTFKFGDITYTTSTRMSGPWSGTDAANASWGSPAKLVWHVFNYSGVNQLMTVSVQDLKLIMGVGL